MSKKLEIDICENYMKYYHNAYYLVDGKLCVSTVSGYTSQPNKMYLIFFSIENNNYTEVYKWEEVIYLGINEELILNYLLENNSENKFSHCFKLKESKIV